MCGILGGINADHNNLRAALNFMRHRGPDEEGEMRIGNVSLLHVRLSIQDIIFGQQPFKSGNYIILYNGEIYNHMDLRKKWNLQCETNSDTETLVRLYEKNGINCLSELDGMFAFTIFDKKARTINIFRDRAGKKPLYYYFRNDEFVFASELNCLRRTGSFQINYDNIVQYLRYSFTGPSTPYTDVFELEAGCYMQINIDTLKFRYERWWSINEFYLSRNRFSLEKNIEYLDNILNKSVLSRLTSSDLEVGTFLSGGIDSGLVTAIASRNINNLKTFTISFQGQYDESNLAELVAKKYGTKHVNINISFSQLSNDLENILYNYGEPFGDSSAIPSYYVSREAKKFLTVILNGDGADELFGGYRRYVPFAHYDFFTSKKFVKSVFRKLSSGLPYPKEKMSPYNYFFRLCDLAGKAPLKSYLSSTYDIFEGFEEDFAYRVDPFKEMEKYMDLLHEKNLSGLRKIMCLDFHYLFPNDLLVKMDIATMANSLEARSPFLSRDILEFAPTVADNYKIRGITTKYILRQLSKKYLPQEIISQPKRGFEVPLKIWIDNDLKEIVFDYLSGNTFSGEFIKPKFITDLLENKAPVAPEKRAKMLWVLMALEIWHKKCYM